MSLAIFLFGVVFGGLLGWGLATLWCHPWAVAATLDRLKQERYEETVPPPVVLARRRSTVPARMPGRSKTTPNGHFLI